MDKNCNFFFDKSFCLSEVLMRKYGRTKLLIKLYVVNFRTIFFFLIGDVGGRRVCLNSNYFSNKLKLFSQQMMRTITH